MRSNHRYSYLSMGLMPAEESIKIGTELSKFGTRALLYTIVCECECVRVQCMRALRARVCKRIYSKSGSVHFKLY